MVAVLEHETKPRWNIHCFFALQYLFWQLVYELPFNESSETFYIMNILIKDSRSK